MSYYDPDLGRNVLIQDAEQVQQSTKKARETRERKEQADSIAAQKEYEKDVASAEAQYQKEVAEYNRQVAEAEKLAKQQDPYTTEIARLEAKKQQKLSDAQYSVWGPGGSRNSSELKEKQNKISKEYNSLIKRVSEQRRIARGYEEFSRAYPGISVLPSNIADTFRSSPSFSLVGLYEQKVESKAAKAEYDRQASAQTAQAIARKQSAEYHGNIPNIGFISSGLGTQRGEAVKSTPETYSTLLGGGKKAVETRARLTNVDTGQSIMGGQQASPEITITRTETYRETPGGPVLVRNVERTIPERKESKGAPSFANPLAFVASLDRQNVDAAGVPIKEKVQPKSNIEVLKETLSRYQALTGEQRTPYKSVLEASLTEKGRRIDPISKLFIEQSALKQYSTRAEAFGLVEAKGRKGIIKKDGKQIFDLETGLGDVTLGRKLGFVYDYNLQRPTEEKPVLFEGSLQYVLAPKVQGPQQPKLEEAVAFPGTIEYATKPEPKQSELGAEIQRGFESLEADSQWLQTNPKSENPLLAAYQTVAPVGIAVGKSLSAMMAFGVNQAEQVQLPYYTKLLGLKEPKKVAPIFVGDASGVAALPINFEKLNILKPETYAPSFQPPWEKEYQEKQKAYIKKYGPLEYGAGIVFDYGFAVPGLIKTGVKTAPKLFSVIAKPALPRIGMAAREAALLGSTGKITTPSRMWDVAEPVQKVGLRIEKKVQPTWAVSKQQLPVPNYGKERIIPYYLRQGITRVADFGKRVIEKPRGFTTPVFLKNFSDISLNPKHLGDKPNIPTRQQLERPPDYKRTYPTLGVMRGIFYPDIPTPRQKAPLIPEGFTKINPKLITVKKSARQIIKFPTLFKTKLSLPKPKTPQFIKKSQQQWQAFTFMQKKRFGEFKESLPTLPPLPKPKANQFVTFQRKARDIKSGILETKRLGLQLFEWPTPKKQVVPAFSKRELTNLTREDIVIPSNVKDSKPKIRPLDQSDEPNLKLIVNLDDLQKQIGILEGRKIMHYDEIAIAYDIKTQKPNKWIPDEKSKNFIDNFSVKTKYVNLSSGEIGGYGRVIRGTSDDILAFFYKEQKRLSPSFPPVKPPPFMEGFIEKPFRARRGRSPIEISRFSDVSGIGRVSQIPDSFYQQRRRFPKSPVEFGIIPKGTGMDSLKGPAAEWSKNWMLKQRKVSSQDYLYRLEKVQGKRQWIEYPAPKIEKLGLVRSALPSKATRITSERFRQMPKFDPSWPTPPKPVQGDEFMNQLIALRRQPKESGMLFSDPRRTSKVNVKLLNIEADKALSDYFKTATPFQLKQPKVGEWPDNWKQLAKSNLPDVDDYLSQKRSFRSFGKTEKEKMLRGVGGAGASSYGNIGFKRYGTPTTKPFVLKRATPPVSFPVKRETGMFRLMNRSAEEQGKLDIATRQTIARIMTERRTSKKGQLPTITTRSQDTSRTFYEKARLSFISEPIRTSPVFVQRQKGVFDRPLTIRKGKLLGGLKPVQTLPDRYREIRILPKQGKPMIYSGWQPRPLKVKSLESKSSFKREVINYSQTFNKDTALPNIIPAKILESKKFTKIEVSLGKGKTDVFFRRFEKSPIGSPKKDLKKRKSVFDDVSKERRSELDKKWDDSQKRIESENRASKGGQILVPPETRNPLKLPDPEVPVPEAFADVGAKVPFKKDKYKLPLIIPPTPKETKKERPIQISQTYESIILSDNRPKISTVQTPRISLSYSTPQRVEESFRIKSIQPAKIEVTSRQTTKTRPRQKAYTIQTPKYDVISIQKISPRLAQKQTPKLSSPLAPKAPTRLRAPQRQPLREKPKQISLLRTRPPRKPPRVIFALPPDKEPKKPKPKKEEKSVLGFFLGNVPESQISGVFKRKEITLGKERIEKTRRGDVRVLAGKPRRTSKKKQQYDLLGFKKGKTKFF